MLVRLSVVSGVPSQRYGWGSEVALKVVREPVPKAAWAGLPLVMSLLHLSVRSQAERIVVLFLVEELY